MCQFCNLLKFGHRAAPLGAASRSRSRWGNLATHQSPQPQIGLQQRSPFNTRSFSETVVRSQFDASISED